MNFLKNLFKLSTPKTGIVFVIEDNPAYAKTTEIFLRQSFPSIKDVQIFPVGETCLPELHKSPDLIIIDYFLDSKYHDAKTGLEIIKQIRAERPELNIIVLSSQTEIDIVIWAIKTYKCSYIKKDEHAFGRIEEVIKEIYG